MENKEQKIKPKKDTKNFLGYRKSEMNGVKKSTKIVLGVAIILLALSLIMNSQGFEVVSFLGGLAIGTVVIKFISLIIYKVIKALDKNTEVKSFNIFSYTYLTIAVFVFISVIFA